MCGGAYIKISSEGIELGTAGNLRFKSAVLQKMGPATLKPYKSLLAISQNSAYSQKIKLVTTANALNLKDIPYYISDPITGHEIYGRTDKYGYTSRIFTQNRSELYILIGKKALHYLSKRNIKI
jgi:type VI secretion system secreted protein VgrG